MSFLNEVIQKLRPLFPFYEGVVNNKTIHLVTGEKGVAIGFSSNGTKDLKEVATLRRISDQGLPSSINVMCYAHVLVNGPKVFQPSCQNLEALEQMDLNVDFPSYVQPFQTVIIEFPEQYSKKMIVKNFCQDPSFSPTDEHDPAYVILYHSPEKQILLVNVQFTSGSLYTTILWPRLGPETTLEQVLSESLNLEHYEGSLPVTREEGQVATRAIRTAINCILVMEELGIKKIGPQNESHYNRLALRVHKQHDPEKRIAARRDLAAMPIIYSFDQNVKLYGEAHENCDHSRENGHSVKCHWRRGHWRMQPHGPSNTLRKRIRIAAILVNDHQFAGKVSDTTYTKEI
jgi:hypothetical protein